MKMVFERTWLIMCFLLLVSCQEPLTYSYLMEHPKALDKAFTHCQANQDKTEQEILPCDIVRTAARDFDVLNRLHEMNPVFFGKRLLVAEMEWQEAKQVFEQTRAHLTELKRASNADLTFARDKLESSKRDYERKEARVKQMLAVISLTGPE